MPAAFSPCLLYYYVCDHDSLIAHITIGFQGRISARMRRVIWNMKWMVVIKVTGNKEKQDYIYIHGSDSSTNVNVLYLSKNMLYFMIPKYLPSNPSREKRQGNHQQKHDLIRLFWRMKNQLETSLMPKTTWVQDTIGRRPIGFLVGNLSVSVRFVLTKWEAPIGPLMNCLQDCLWIIGLFYS